MKKAISTKKAPEAIGPYSQAIEFCKIVFLSGQIPLTPDGKFIDGGIEEQTIQVMENLKAVLEAANSSLKNIVKATIYLTDLNNFQAVNEVYGSYFQNNPPARACVQVSALPKGAKIEIDAIAVKP